MGFQWGRPSPVFASAELARVAADLNASVAQVAPYIVMGSFQILRRLVLGWIDSYDSNQILIFSGFSRSTKLSG